MDELIILRSSTRRMAKLIRSTPEGLHVEGYDEAATFAWEVRPVDGIEALAMELEHLARDPHACVIRGSIKPACSAKKVVNRRQHVGKDGVEGDWDNHRPGRRWVAFDIDKLTLPDSMRESPDVRSMVTLARGSLPEPFASTACAYHLSASAGLDDWKTVSMHLWFWLDRPVYDLSWRRWAEGKAVDAAFFKSVQPHYTADPICEGFTDHLAGVRTGLIAGLRDVVQVPEELQDFDGWQATVDAELRAKAAELEAKRAAIVGAPEQSASAARAFAIKTLAGAIDDILSAPVGGRHDMLCRKARRIGGYVQPGFLDESEAWGAIEAAIVAIYDAKRHATARKSAREFFEKGMEQPYDVSTVGRKPAKKPVLRVVPDPVDDDIPMPDGGANVARKAKRKASGVEWVDMGEKGAILPTAANLAALMDWMGYRARRNLMSHQTEWEGAPSDIARECQQAAMASIIMDEAARLGWTLSEASFWRSLSAVEARRAYHPVVDWVRAKPWDGVPRFEYLFGTLTVKPEFVEFAGLMRIQLERWLIAGGKCLALSSNASEGIAVQGVLVLQGKQDLGKTRWFRSLLPHPSWVFEGAKMDPSNKDLVIAATSAFLTELGELDGTTKKSDVAELKAFLTRATDEYRAPYARKSETYPRRTLFGATVNPDEFLVDTTGNRRFWMMPVDAADSNHGLDMQQIWAEAVARAEAGEPHWMPDEHKAGQLALAAKFETRSEWADDFFRCWRMPVQGESVSWVKVSDIRQQMCPDRHWPQSELKSFTQFLKSSGVQLSLRQGVRYACVVRW